MHGESETERMIHEAAITFVENTGTHPIEIRVTPSHAIQLAMTGRGVRNWFGTPIVADRRLPPGMVYAR